MSKETPIFAGKVTDGKLIIFNRKAFDNFLLTLNGDVSLEIRQWSKRRTLDQNALLWVYYSIIANDTGNTAQEIHEIAKRELLEPQFVTYKKKTYKIPGSTTKLSKSEFGDFLDRIASWSGVPIPNLEVQ